MRRYTIKVGENEYIIDVQELSANNFRVWVENHELDVQLAADMDIAEATITPQIVPGRQEGEALERPAATYRPPAVETIPPLAVPQPAAQPAHLPLPVEGAHHELTAPMPGTILAMNVTPGEAVARGQVLLILEAMKMKNSIKSPQDGVIAEVVAQPGQAVGYGAVLLRFAR
jgi:glutaconyl-CoA/methylmalonyl-CoA decarboxylase subunit gamma